MEKIYCAKWDYDCEMDDENNKKTYWHHEENIRPYYNQLVRQKLKDIKDQYDEEFEDNDYSIDEIIDDYISMNLAICEIVFEDKE